MPSNPVSNPFVDIIQGDFRKYFETLNNIVFGG